jgi:hypothetical protein
MKLFDKLFGKKPVIMTEYGPVTERARHQAALNMAADHACRERVEAILIKQYGPALGLEEARRRYPEAYSEAYPEAHQQEEA